MGALVSAENFNLSVRHAVPRAVGRGIAPLLLTLAVGGCGMHLASSSSGPNLGLGGLATRVSSAASAQPSDHPQQIPVGRLERWLGQLKVRLPARALDELTDSSGQMRSVFTARRLPAVADALSHELAQATPRQDVAIRVEQYRNAFFGVQRSPRVTALRAFVVHGQLNLIFGTLGQNPDRIRPGHTVTSAVAAPSPRLDRAANYMREIGSRAAAGKGPGVLVLPSFARRREASRPDWIVINLESPSSSRLPAEHPTPALRSVAPSSSTSSDATRPTSPSTEPFPATLESKLRALKHLHDKHLIDDSLYRTEEKSLIQRYLND
jgi:hypothetical protein